LTTTNQNLVTSPKAMIYWMAASTPTKTQTGKEKYSVRLAFDVKKDKDFLEQVKEVNKKLVVTEHTYQGESREVEELLSKGKALVGASSIFKPICFDAEGNELEENPLFFKESTGIAQMIYEPYKGEKGGSLNLTGIIIHSIDNPEGAGEGMSREARLAQLREYVGNKI